MAALTDLINQVEDKTMRERLLQEAARLSKQKKFGLVFEEHIPECTPLYGIYIKQGSTVAKKIGSINDILRVTKIDGEKALCLHVSTGEIETVALSDLVPVAQFGEPIYPTLEPMAFVENAPDSSLWHTLIEADNYHALQLLEYLYPKQVDCIYIDPPYNTGAKDWKYNNDYVDSSDNWRHSKWLSMMQKRLKLARNLLNPDTGVLIVTIDEHEVHHLRVLLEQLLPEFYIQMVTTVINPKGVTQGRFSRVEEYIVYCFAPNAFIDASDDNLLNPAVSNRKPRWKGLLRSGTNARREDRKNMFYPVLIDTKLGRVVGTGESLPFNEYPNFDLKIEGYEVAWPIRTDVSLGNWGVGYETLRTLINKGYVSLGKYDSNRKTWGVSYISLPNQKMIEDGHIRIVDKDPITEVVSIEYNDSNNRAIKTIWHRSLHDAGAYGSNLVSSIIGQSRAFSFPKSLYSTKDAIMAVVRNNKNALIADFFAGSGTTLHAVNLLNAEDCGNRRCILVTNNEVSVDEARDIQRNGYQPGDPEWEEHGICRAVTWPRTQYSIMGKRKDGSPLTGEYFTNQTVTKEESRSFYHLGFVGNPAELTHNAKKQIVAVLRGKEGKTQLPQSLVKSDSKFIISEKHSTSILFNVDAVDEWLYALEDQDHITNFYIVVTETVAFKAIKARVSELLGTITVTAQIKRPMSLGLPANVEYFKLGFLDKNDVAMGKQFKEILPLLWLKAGAVGKRPELDGEILDLLILPQNKMAVLANESDFVKFETELDEYPGIETVFIVTDSERAYREMISGLKVKNTYQLYRDYLDNFRINARR